jgi:glycerol-3-phosphate dehydrogenase subunit C
LPTFHRETFSLWFGKNKGEAKASVSGGQGKVAYFPGCFANYYQPELARAVVRILKKNGIEAILPPHECCGMPMIANKNMTGFRRNAERNIRTLASCVKDGWDVVTSCPSCALMLKHGYPGLCRQAESSLVSQHVFYIDEYLVRLWREGRLLNDMAEVTQTVLCHIPCHLKAQDEGRSTLELLGTVPGLTIAAANAACCGMGGYHGYRRAYSRLSMDIGRKLFEDIKNAGADTVVTGCAACGMQIRHGTGVTAIHTVQLLERAYGLDRPGH